MKKCCENKDPARLNKVGGQAVLEGVMMKAGQRTVTTCRKEDGTLSVTASELWRSFDMANYYNNEKYCFVVTET
mgnify:CR=1 FL=1